MAIEAGMLFERMAEAGRGLAGDIWGRMETFAIPELKKIAIQIEALADPASPWSLEESRLLLDMQVRAAVTVIVAMTDLVLLAVQNAINAILAAVRDFVNGAVGIPLI